MIYFKTTSNYIITQVKVTAWHITQEEYCNFLHEKKKEKRKKERKKDTSSTQIQILTVIKYSISLW